MTTKKCRFCNELIMRFVAIVILVMPLASSGQTKIKLAKNKYTPAQDVELGQGAVQEIEKQVKLWPDAEVTNYVRGVGRALVEAIPPEFQQPVFQYSFKVVDAKEINAFALPGGPMYVNTGMIRAAHVEGEMAGVMAHEISHVALRHATAQQTKSEKLQWGSLAGIIGGAVVGGGLGEIIAQGAQTGFGVWGLKYSREFESEADILGSQILAGANYDPRDLANMFKTIAEQGGGGQPQWLSSHPNPENRYGRIEQEARVMRVENPKRESEEFTRIQSRLSSGRPANPRGEATRGEASRPAGKVEAPSTQYRTYSGSNLFRVDVPENWREMPSENSVWFVPEGGSGQIQGQTVFTHAVNVGVTRAQSRDLRQATDQFIQSLAQGNRNLRQSDSYQRAALGGRDGLVARLANVSEATGRQEVVSLRTTLLRNGDLFYVIALAPQDDFQSYQGAFQNVLRSLQIRD
jgi:Zn-dependent protease with chaperone function